MNDERAASTSSAGSRGCGSAPSRSPCSRSGSSPRASRRATSAGLGLTAAVARRRACCSSRERSRARRVAPIGALALAFDTAIVSATRSSSASSTAAPTAVGAHLPGRRGGAPVRDPRRRRSSRSSCCRARVPRVVARRPLRPARLRARPCHLPARAAADHRPDRRLARPAAAARGRRPRTRARPRPNACATSSAGASTCSRRPDRCARALGSSLDLDEAFGAFIRELRASSRSTGRRSSSPRAARRT